MTESATADAEFPLRVEKPFHPFFWIGHEVFDLYVQIMGPDCYAVYNYFARRYHSDPTLTHDIRSMAPSCGLKPSTISRALEVLEHLELVKLIRFKGSRASECQLSDAWVIANRLGAKFDSNSQTYQFPLQVSERLKSEVHAIRQRQQGKPSRDAGSPRANFCGNLKRSVSQRDAGVSPERRQRSTRETRTGTHLIQKEERTEKNPTPHPPTHDGEAQAEKADSDKDDPDGLLKWAEAVFTGPMNDLGDHLFDTSKPPNPRFKNGFQEWEDFAFGSLAVKAAEWRGAVLVLTLSASDPAAARAGLVKYRRTWEPSLRRWYRCEVRCEVQELRTGIAVNGAETATEC